MAALPRAAAGARHPVCYAVTLPQVPRQPGLLRPDRRSPTVLALVDDPDRLAMIIADARMVADKIDELIDGNPLR